jgi:hypothetical protein
MGKARAIELETRVFTKAGDATIFFRRMLNRYSIGDRVSEEDAADLRSLLKRHEEMDEKTGSGIDHFVVDYAPEEYSGQCFWIVRTDGSKIDFSFKHCLARKPYD